MVVKGFLTMCNYKKNYFRVMHLQLCADALKVQNPIKYNFQVTHAINMLNHGQKLCPFSPLPSHVFYLVKWVTSLSLS